MIKTDIKYNMPMSMDNARDFHE